MFLLYQTHSNLLRWENWLPQKSYLMKLVYGNCKLTGDTYKIKQTQGHILTDNTQVENITMMVPETQNTTHITSFTIPETRKLPELPSAIFHKTQKTRDI